jgi:hypothetical protein
MHSYVDKISFLKKNVGVTTRLRCTGPTRAQKIVGQRFMAWMHQNALRDPQIARVAKTQVWRNVSHSAFY